MQHDEGDEAVLVGLLTQQVHHVELVVQIQGRQGFVEQQQPRPADECLGNAHQLLLAAGELIEIAHGQMVHPQALEQRHDGFQRDVLGLLRERRGARGHQYRLHHAQMHRGRQRLRQVDDVAGSFAEIQRGEIGAVKAHGAMAGRQQAGHGLEQRGLAGAVGPQQRDQLAGGDG